MSLQPMTLVCVRRNLDAVLALPRLGAWFLLSPALVAINTIAAAASPTPAPPVQQATPPQRLLTAAATLQGTISYAKLEVRVDQPLAVAKGGLVSLGIKYEGPGHVASVQVPDAGSYAIGPFTGNFQHTVVNADVRALLKTNEAAILARCKSTLDTKQVDVIETVHDAAIPLTVNAADGAVLASTTVAYQVGLVCRNPLPPMNAAIGYAKIEYDINRPLAQAKGGLVPLSLRFNGVASVQVPGSLSYPLGTSPGSFEQTIPNADIRAILKRDEAAILARCKSTLDANNVSMIDTVHDTRIPVTVHAENGTVIGSTTVPYQLGLTCRR